LDNNYTSSRKRDTENLSLIRFLEIFAEAL